MIVVIIVLAILVGNIVVAIAFGVRDMRAPPPPPPAPPAPPTAQEIADATLNSAARSLVIASVANAIVNKGRK